MYAELGQKSSYDPHYNPERLFAIARASKREEIGIDEVALPFYGVDQWTHYEVSWLNPHGKPMVAVAFIQYPCTTPCLVESKSLKLYFNSFNNTQFANLTALQHTIIRDLSKCVQGPVEVTLYPLHAPELRALHSAFTGDCLDALDVTCSVYTVEPAYLTVDDEPVSEILYSDLLKSNCLVTYQPDWGSVQITYTGPKINHEGLLKYLISFRNHNEFHEQCIERIFIDILNRCKPTELSVYGRYTRRGGLDINPYRSTANKVPNDLNQRLVRQ
jgi:7-cyano-7-deazaguanine reductase